MNKSVKKILEEYTQGKVTGYSLKPRFLSATTQYVLAWPEFTEQDMPDAAFRPRYLYLIYNDDRPVGIVEVFNENLEAYLQPASRGKGIFSGAMREYILPHLLQGRPLQRITIKKADFPERRFEVLKKIFLALGFTLLKEDAELRMIIDASSRPVNRFIGGENKPVPPARKESLKKELAWYSYRLTLIQSELIQQEGISYVSEDIGDISAKLRAYGERW